MENELKKFDPNEMSAYPDEVSAEPDQPRPEIVPQMSQKEAAGVSAQQGFTFGYGPEMEAYRRAYDELRKRGELGEPQFPSTVGIGAPPVILPMATDQAGEYRSLINSPEYKQFLKEERSRVRGAREQYPVTSFGSEVAGSVANPATWIAPEAKAGQFFTNILRRGVPAGAQVAAYNEPKRPYEADDTVSDKALKFGEGMIAGNVIGPLVGAAATGTVKAGEQLLEAAKRLQAAGYPIPDIPRYLTTDSKVALWLSQKLAKTPISGGPLNEVPELYREGLQATKEGIIEGVNPATSSQGIYDAGRKVQNDIGSWVDSQKDYFNDQYENVLKSIIDPNARTPMQNTNKAVLDIIQRRADLGKGSFNWSDPRDARKATSGIIQIVQDAMNDPNFKNFWQLKELRTHLREVAGNPANNISKSEYDTMYKALSADMEEAAKLSGKSNYDEYKRVDKEYIDSLNALSDFQNFFGNFEKRGGDYVFDKSPENLVGQITSAMRSGKGGDYTKVKTMMGVLSPEGQEALRKTIISDLGKEASPVAPDVSDFNPEKFLKQYGSLDKRAKLEMFGPELKSALDDFYTLSSPYSSKSPSSMRAISAPSDTAEQVGEMKVFASGYINAVNTLAALVGGRGFSSAMASPTSVKQTSLLARSMQALARNPASEVAQASFVQALKQAPIVFSERNDIADYARAAGVGADIAAKMKEMYYGSKEPPAEQASGGRVARKAGGRIKTNPISAEVKRVRTLLSQKTANMLSLPDDAIATALHIAKRT